MKALNKYIISAGMVVSMMSLGSCTGDLDLMPTDPNNTTAAEFATDPEKYMDAVMADVYLQHATNGVNNNSSVSGFDGGMSTFQRAAFILEEVPSDEANWLPNDADYGTFQYGIVPSNNRVILGTYSRFMINVTVCNDFIQTVNNGYFGLPDNLKDKAEEYVRQAKILRSANYFYLIDCFGNVPYADENTATGSVPAQLDRKEIFNYVTNTLEDVIAEYNAKAPNATQRYGYVGKEVAEALLVKFYLNAQVYTGSPMWDKCLQHAQTIIKAHQGTGFKGSGLAEHYNQLFGANNDAYAIGGSNAVNEIIWTIPQDNPNLLSWANGTFMLDAWIGETNGCTKAMYNAGDAWKCMTARRQFVEKFDWDASMGSSPDARVADWCTSAQGFNPDNGVLTQDNYGDNGYLPVKFTNWNIDANGNKSVDASPSPTTQIGTDYPVIRLAEIYLSAAEAILNGAGDRGQALEYVNYIRERAGLQPWNAAQLSANSLQDERCRELYTENCRRTDLIRYGKWISGYTWNWKNQVPSGADFNASFALYPLPSSTVTLAGYTQNPGY